MSTLTDLKDSIYGAVRSRIQNPLAGSFIIAWCSINWKLLYTTFLLSEDKLPINTTTGERYADKLTYLETLPHGLNELLWWPLWYGTLVLLGLAVGGALSNLAVDGIRQLYRGADAKLLKGKYIDEATADRLREALTNVRKEKNELDDEVHRLADQLKQETGARADAEATSVRIGKRADTVEQQFNEAKAELESSKKEHEQGLESLKAEHEATVTEMEKARKDGEAGLQEQLNRAKSELIAIGKSHMKELQSERSKFGQLMDDRDRLKQELAAMHGNQPPGKTDSLPVSERVKRESDKLYGVFGTESLLHFHALQQSAYPLGTLFPGNWEKRWAGTRTLGSQSLDRREIAALSEEGDYQVENGWKWRLNELAFHEEGSISFEQSGPEPTRYICLYAVAPNRYVGVEGYQNTEDAEPTLYRVAYVRVDEPSSQGPFPGTVATIPVERWFTEPEGISSVFPGRWRKTWQSVRTDDAPYDQWVEVRVDRPNEVVFGTEHLGIDKYETDGPILRIHFNGSNGTLELTRVSVGRYEGQESMHVGADGNSTLIRPVRFERLQ